MEKIDVDSSRIGSLELPTFDGFPYLLTRLSAAFYHVILLPRERSVTELSVVAAAQARLNDLPTCLLLGHDSCCYYDATGTATHSKDTPRGRALSFGKLKPFVKICVTGELASRMDRLKSFAEKRHGYLFGDLSKGGHSASAEEAGRLAGKQANGVPVGLIRCSDCGQWKGECLDPSPTFKGQVMTVHCQCDNRNYCAGCGRWFYPYKLNANYFDETDGQIWHVPGFAAFEHRCPESDTRPSGFAGCWVKTARS
jgi:hypothetical protein